MNSEEVGIYLSIMLGYGLIIAMIITIITCIINNNIFTMVSILIGIISLLLLFNYFLYTDNP